MKANGDRLTLTATATVLAPISWGTTYVVITELLPAGRPMLVSALRVLPAGVLLLGVTVFSSRAGRPVLHSVWRPHGRQWAQTAILALFNFGIFFPLLAVAVYRLPGGVAAAAGGMQPLLVLSLSAGLTRTRLPARDVAIGLAAALGVALVVLRPGAHFDSVGLLAALGANVSFAIGVVLTKRFPTPPNRLAATGWQLLLGGLVLLPLAILAEGPPPALDVANLLGFLYLSLVGTALAFVVWFDGIRRLPSAAPPLLGLAAPVTGALLGFIVLDQALSPVQLLGFVVSVSAIAYGATVREPGRRRHTSGWTPPLAAPTAPAPLFRCS